MRERKIIELYYGFNGECLKDETIAKIFNISTSYVNRLRNGALRILTEHLTENKIILAKAKKNYSTVCENGVSNDEKIIFCAKKVIEENYTINDLAKLLDVSVKSIVICLTRNLKIIDEHLYTQVQEVLNRQGDIVCLSADNSIVYNYEKLNSDLIDEEVLLSHFKNVSCTKEEILDAIDQLSPRDRGIIIKRYGLDGVEMTNTELANELGLKPSEMANKVHYIKKIIIKKMTLKKSSLQGEVTMNSEIKDEFSEYREYVKSLIDFLTDENEKQVLLLRLGCIQEKYYTEKEISSIMKIPVEEIHKIVHQALINIATVSSKTLKGIECAIREVILKK